MSTDTMTTGSRRSTSRARPLPTLVAAALLAGASLVLQAPSASAAAPAADRRTTTVSTQAVSRATREGQRATRFAFAVRVTDNTALVAGNRAHARASCRNCRALAVSVQIVVAGHVKDIADAPAPGQKPAVRVSNLAVAEDLARGVRSRSTKGVAGCSRCSTTALAYQFVIVGRHRLQITPEARSRLATIKSRMQRVTASGASPATVRTRLDALAREIDSVLRTGVVLAPH